MRAYGNNTDILIDRDREARSHGLLAQRDLAPPLLARFHNGLLYRYIPGKVCKAEDLTSEPVWRGVAKKLAEWHARLPIRGVSEEGTPGSGNTGQSPSPSDSAQSTVSLPTSAIEARSPSPNIWSVMQRWVLALPEGTDKERARKEQLWKELERSYKELDNTNGLGDEGLVLGHCDLLSANVIILPKATKAATSGQEDVAFIDYEYATPCPAAFDISNHFAEWGGYDCDYNMLPTRAVRRAFLSEYLQSFKVHSDQAITDDALERLFNDIDRYRGMPGFYWGVWALIQATISEIDFPYASYAEERLGEYWDWRAEIEGTRKGEMPLRERRWAQQE